MFLPPGFSVASNGQIYSSDGRGPYPFSEASFFFGRRFFAWKGLTIPSGQKILFKFTVGVDSLLRKLVLTLDDGHAQLTLLQGGTPSGAFSDTINPSSTNWTEEVVPYATQNSLEATPVGNPSVTGGTPKDIFRLKTANTAANSNTVETGLTTELGLGVGEHFVLVENIGAGNVSGLLKFLWDEVPNN